MRSFLRRLLNVMANDFNQSEPDWKVLTPERKVQIVKTMGFTPMWEEHTSDWIPPDDVIKFRKETHEDPRDRDRSE